MYRSFSWFLCAALLCFGQILSLENHEIAAHAQPVEPTNNSISAPAVPHSTIEQAAPKNQNVKPEETPVPNHDGADRPHPKPQTTTTEKLTTPKTEPTTSTTTVAPPEPTKHTTTAAPPKPTEPTTTAATPELTKSTTTAAPPSTPSNHTSTTSTPSPTPSPKPAPSKGSWNVTDKNITCLRIDGFFSIDYTYLFNKTTNVTTHFDVPKEAGSIGKCDKNSDEITLFWNATQIIKNSLKFIFYKNGSDYVLKTFQGSVFIPELSNNKTQEFNTNNNDTHFSTPVGQSYSCSSIRQVTVNQHAKVILDQFHLQAFKNSTGTGFDTSKDCQVPPHTADYVPIVVGCILAFLVIAVLVAYLISRRRSLTRGYLSM